MTQKAFPLSNSPILTVEDWSKIAQNWLDTGVIKGQLNELQVYADSTGMQIKVRSGQAYIKGHFYESDAEETLAIGAANSSNPRIDRVIVRLDWTANTIQLSVLQGVAAVSPSAPALTQNSSRWEISLAQIYIGATVTTIIAGNVTDERFPTGFITPTYFNGWTSDDLATKSRYWKEGNTVYYELALKGGDTAQNATILIFPSGYKPANDLLRTGYAENATTGGDVIYVIDSTGALKLLRTIIGNSLMILTGSFKAVN